MAPPFVRRLFQFHLRSFLLVCLALGIGLAGVESVLRVVRCVQTLESHGVVVQSNFQDRYGTLPFNRQQTWKAVLEWSLSNPEDVVTNSNSKVQIGDILNQLATLTTVRNLDLTSSGVSSKDLRLLAPLRDLEQLDLKNTSIDDAGLTVLVNMPALRKLNLSATKVTDTGLATLARISSLKLVYLFGTSVSKEALEGLRSARPDLTVCDTLFVPGEMRSVSESVAVKPA